MFSNFKEKTNNRIAIKNLDSTALELILDFIYTGKITITEENAQVKDNIIGFICM